MNRRFLSLPFWIVCLLLASLTARAADPDWVRSVVEAPARSYPEEATHAVLFQEERQVVEPDGKSRTTHRVALRILRQEGVHAAKFSQVFLRTTEKVSGMRVWLFRNGANLKVAKVLREWADNPVEGEGTAYSEYRRKEADLSDVAAPGDIVMAEWIHSGPLLFLTLAREWDARVPHDLDVFDLQLPKGWSAAYHNVGAATFRPTVSEDGSHLVWRRGWAQCRPTEPDAPASEYVEGEVQLILRPAPGVNPRPVGFTDWNAVSRWIDLLGEGTCDRSPDLDAKTSAVCGSGGDDRRARLDALATFVQRIPYLSVVKGLGLGFGYKPQAATTVLRQFRGDCKDKSNLFRSMANREGWTVYRVAAQTGDEAVTEDWPTPVQFNHAIVAIAVDDGSGETMAVQTRQFGRLLFFDPTSETVPLGALPDYLENHTVLVFDGSKSELVTLPANPLQPPHRERKVTFSLESTGDVVADGEYIWNLSAMGAVRSLHRSKRPAAIKEIYQASFHALLGPTQFSLWESSESARTQLFVTRFSLTAQRIGQSLPDGRVVIPLLSFSNDHLPHNPAPERRLALHQRSDSWEETVTLRLAPEFEVLDLPSSSLAESKYGFLRTEWTSSPGLVVVKRSAVWNDIIVPADHYKAYKEFLGKVSRASRANVLVKRAK